ncbi:unnamed protein product [Cyprideis torosa]|uniref:CCHC-type domain-containing protein n=1 Tax=Cyprideis torosa TaxID=163714 RepID=A0A7R8ZR03_9CRUS|nr:unnamed protein product [Cyprideis torosa]CAG0897670.1 unnamed protein product [Cyprideis torosa]
MDPRPENPPLNVASGGDAKKASNEPSNQQQSRAAKRKNRKKKTILYVPPAKRDGACPTTEGAVASRPVKKDTEAHGATATQESCGQSKKLPSCQALEQSTPHDGQEFPLLDKVFAASRSAEKAEKAEQKATISPELREDPPKAKTNHANSKTCPHSVKLRRGDTQEFSSACAACLEAQGTLKSRKWSKEEILASNRSLIIEELSRSKDINMLPPPFIPLMTMFSLKEVREKEENKSFPVPQELLKAFSSDFIKTRKENKKCKKGPYHCRLCQFIASNCVTMFNHIQKQRHRMLVEERRMQTDLRRLPSPNKEHKRGLTKMIEDIFLEHGLRDEDIAMREEIALELNVALREVASGDVQLSMIGSSLSGLGLRTSALDLSLDLVDPIEAGAASNPRAELRRRTKENALLTFAFLRLKSAIEAGSPKFRDLVSDLTAICPKMKFIYLSESSQELPVIIHIKQGPAAIWTNSLLRDYASLDPRVKPICVAMKYWAHQVEIDSQDNGAWPTLVYHLLVINFLQHTNPPVLPCLQEAPEYQDTEGYIPLSQLRIAKTWSSLNSQSLGSLWWNIFREYSVQSSDNAVVSIRTLRHINIAEKAYGGRRINVEDPFNPKRNSAAGPAATAYSVIMRRFLFAFAYFGQYKRTLAAVERAKERSLEQAAGGEATRPRTPPCLAEDGVEEEGDVPVEGEEDEGLEEGARAKTPPTVDNEGETKVSVTVDHLLQQLALASPLPLDQTETASVPLENEDVASPQPLPPAGPPPPSVDIPEDQEPWTFNFSPAVLEELTRGDIIEVVCKECSKPGHLRSHCPKFALPKIKPLPPMNPDFLRLLDDLIYLVREHCRIREEELQIREEIRTDLEFVLRKEFQVTSVRLHLFGSSANGFGFFHSDVDLCMTFEDRPEGPKRTTEEVESSIRIVARALRRHRALSYILPITNAKVPIVKFFHMHHDLEGDISLSNTLALRNTRLLSAYASIDDRVTALGYMLKVFAKTCDIGDASKGSLSSYAYMLMLIHFLQHRQPPVLPCLQELYPKDKEPPVRIEEGWNTWFFEDIGRLHEVWPYRGANRESVGQLWNGFLEYYTVQFPWREQVVSICQSCSLTRFEKLWNGTTIAIEDPFDLSHNLGGGLSHRMNAHIFKALIRGREVFGTPIASVPRTYSERNQDIILCPSAPMDFKLLRIMNYLISPAALTLGVGTAPNDRGCHFCRRVGHQVKDCPLRGGGGGKKAEAEKATGGEAAVNGVKAEDVTEDVTVNDDRCCFACGRPGHFVYECPQRKIKTNIRKKNVVPPPPPQPQQHYNMGRGPKGKEGSRRGGGNALGSNPQRGRGAAARGSGRGGPNITTMQLAEMDRSNRIRDQISLSSSLPGLQTLPWVMPPRPPPLNPGSDAIIPRNFAGVAVEWTGAALQPQFRSLLNPLAGGPDPKALHMAQTLPLGENPVFMRGPMQHPYNPPLIPCPPRFMFPTAPQPGQFLADAALYDRVSIMRGPAPTSTTSDYNDARGQGPAFF